MTDNEIKRIGNVLYDCTDKELNEILEQFVHRWAKSKYYEKSTSEYQKEALEHIVKIAKCDEFDYNGYAVDDVSPTSDALVWCRANAPKCYSDYTDDELWEAMKSTYLSINGTV